MSRIFGKLPSGERLARIKASPQWKSRTFSNQHFTPDLAEDATMWKVLKAYRRKPATVKPSGPLPSARPDFESLTPDKAAIIWFGHSTYYLQAGGLRMLVDPVLSGRASPVPGTVKAFEGTDIIQPEDFPELDYVLLSHDHYDHLDYHTVLRLAPKVSHWIASLGVGAHLEYWGIPPEKIIELDWWESAQLKNACIITAAPARHFSGRGLKRA